MHKLVSRRGPGTQQALINAGGHSLSSPWERQEGGSLHFSALIYQYLRTYSGQGGVTLPSEHPLPREAGGGHWSGVGIHVLGGLSCCVCTHAGQAQGLCESYQQALTSWDIKDFVVL